MKIIRISDLPDPTDPKGRSYREVNAEKNHAIPIGTLVQIETGVRLFVVYHGRDCDQTPLYYLSHDREDIIQEDPCFKNQSWIGGYPEESLAIVVKWQ